MNNYTAIVKEVEEGWIGWIEEVPGVNCQEPTKVELVDSLREALKEALAFNRDDALNAAGQDFEEMKIAI